MLKSYLKIALRNIKKQKLYSFINIFGLAVGLTATFLIFSFVHHELTYDEFHDNANHIYRFVTKLTRPNGQGSELVININKVGPAAKEQFPQVEEMARIKNGGSVNIKFDENNYSDYISLYADSTFFQMFGYELTNGNPYEALKDPKSVVISETIAEKIFKDKNPIGEMLRISRKDFRITGVMKDFPARSHLQYDLLLPLKSEP